jgi:hypothetical protein
MVVIHEVLNNIVAIGFRYNGLYFMKLIDLLYLGNDEKANVMVSTETDQFEILHERFGYFDNS